MILLEVLVCSLVMCVFASFVILLVEIKPRELPFLLCSRQRQQNEMCLDPSSQNGATSSSVSYPAKKSLDLLLCTHPSVSSELQSCLTVSTSEVSSPPSIDWTWLPSHPSSSLLLSWHDLIAASLDLNRRGWIPFYLDDGKDQQLFNRQTSK